MEYAVVLNSHGQHELTNDTIESVRRWMTDDILVVTDGATKDISKYSAYVLKGLWHNYHKAPYRNMVLGLLEASKKWAKADWYCYMEYDCLIGSNSYEADLQYSLKHGYWCVGFDHRRFAMKLPLFEKIIKRPISKLDYLLGCCTFHSGDFIRRSQPILERLLYFTNDFSQGFFPDYKEYDFGEVLLPTMAVSMGGKVGGLTRWDATESKWSDGLFHRYPVRFRPEIEEAEAEKAAIIHPIKTYDHPIRKINREKRKAKS